MTNVRLCTYSPKPLKYECRLDLWLRLIWQHGRLLDAYVISIKILRTFSVLLPKSDSDVMFCLQSFQGLIIDRSIAYESYPQDRINTIQYNIYTIQYFFSIKHITMFIAYTLTYIYASDLSIRVSSSGVYKLMFYLTIVNKILRHCHSWLARQYTVHDVCILVHNRYFYVSAFLRCH